METNPLISNVLDTDSYKFSHWLQYPPGTQGMFSYLESRGGDYDHTVFFGLQYYLKRFLSKPVTIRQVVEAEDFAKIHGVPFNSKGWRHIINKHHGRIPVCIRAVPEGTVVPTSNILMSVESTDPEVFWIVSWLETMLVRLWYPITVATRSFHCKQVIREFLEATSDYPKSELPFKLHDFGSRGASSQESAMIGAAAHLVNFQGSDTVAGIVTANHYYNHKMSGFSIPASEHSTMTMWGRERETEAYANMLEQYKDQPIFACVSDSYDIFNAAKNIWGGALRDKVMAYKGTLVVRPDSGDPPAVVVGLLQALGWKFGTTTNSKGYKVIDHNVRVLQGDGNDDENSLRDILFAAQQNGFSATNVAFGMGGGLLQLLNRDTCRFAFKCSYAFIDDKGVEVYKNPITDSGKRSKRGLLELAQDERGEVCTVRRRDVLHFGKHLMRSVYLNGDILVEDDLETIRERTGTILKPYRGWQERAV